MIDQLLQLDYTLFRIINQQLVNPVFDFMLPLFRNKYFWVPVYAFFLSFLVVNFKKKGAFIIFFIFITLFLTDQISATVIKPYVNRMRPCQDVYFADSIRVLVHCGSGRSFPSAHAANHFGFSFFLIVVLRRCMPWLIPAGILWALTVSYAQIYVGVHFPLDIFFGGILGIIIGTWMGFFSRQVVNFHPGKNC